MTTGAQSTSANALLGAVLLHISNMVRGEIALAKAELAEKLQSTRNGLVMIAVALALVPALVGMIFTTLILAMIALGLQPVWVALGVTGLVTLVILTLLMKARSLMRWGDLATSRAVQGLRRDVQTLKEMISNDAPV